MDVHKALLEKGITLPAEETEKVRANFARLKDIYEQIAGWSPPSEAGTKSGKSR